MLGKNGGEDGGNSLRIESIIRGNRWSKPDRAMGIGCICGEDGSRYVMSLPGSLGGGLAQMLVVQYVSDLDNVD